MRRLAAPLLGLLPRLPLVPTARAVWLIAGLAPLALVIAAAMPAAWLIAPAAGAAMLALVIIDALMAGRCNDIVVTAPADTEVGKPARITISAALGAPFAETALAFDARMGSAGRAAVMLRPEHETGRLTGDITLTPVRRGTAPLTQVWLRWHGPLGLGARQIAQGLAQEIRIFPDLSPVRSRELQTFLRDAQSGLIARRIRGEGTQFEALSEYEAGMDRRRIDWKASARHTRLYARENESERNNQIIFAFDCGQAMCEPADGQPRIDRAVTAALTCAYVALKGGDKCALYGFARKPQLLTPFVNDARAFHRLQSAAASLDYVAAEPNFTLALATLTTTLKRRSLIVLFSDFADPTSAQLMVESIGRLLARHLVLFVTIADSDLETLIAAPPADLASMARSVTADSLAQQRRLVLQRLRRMGVDVIEAPWDKIGYQLIDRYLAIRQAEAIG
ncbi:MAG: DUF58 domain-containing protein [Erythrobacter sp.]